jgi:hypothetical protein
VFPSIGFLGGCLLVLEAFMPNSFIYPSISGSQTGSLGEKRREVAF